MKKNSFIITLLLVIVFAITPIFGSEQNDSENRIDTPEEAIKQALEYTGFDRLFDPWGKDSTNVSVSREIASDTSTEYSKKEINGKEIWRVRMNNIVLDLPHKSSASESKYPKDFEVMLDARTAKLLEIRGINSGLEISLKSFDFKNMAADTEQGYHDLPHDRPAINFLEALKITKKLILTAKKITAIYILFSRSFILSGEVVPVWVIYSDELSPFEIGTPGYIFSNQRVVINANTGVLYENSHLGKPIIEKDSVKSMNDNE